MRNPWLVSLAAVIAAGAVVVAPRMIPAASKPEPAQAAQPAPRVEVATPEVRALAESADFLGRLEAVETVDIRARVGGVVDEVAFREGQLVKEGDLLFRIDPRPYRIALDQAQAALRQKLEQRKLAESRRRRSSELADRAIVSRDALEASETQVASLDAEIEAAKAAVASAALNLEYTEVRAPIAGRIGATAVTRGNHVGFPPGTSTPLTSIVSVDPIEVVFDVDEAHYLALLAGGGADPRGRKMKAAVGLMTDDGKPHTGVVDFLDNVFDRSSGTVRFRALLPNPKGALMPGLFARVRLETGEPRPVVVIDERAVAANQAGRFVLVIGPSDTVEMRQVTLGPSPEAGKRVVVEGLSATDRVIMKGFARPGMRVSPASSVASLSTGDRP
jgi:gold/copper resistance efflux system membrane fusion protein